MGWHSFWLAFLLNLFCVLVPSAWCPGSIIILNWKAGSCSLVMIPKVYDFRFRSNWTELAKIYTMYLSVLLYTSVVWQEVAERFRVIVYNDRKVSEGSSWKSSCHELAHLCSPVSIYATYLDVGLLACHLVSLTSSPFLFRFWGCGWSDWRLPCLLPLPLVCEMFTNRNHQEKLSKKYKWVKEIPLCHFNGMLDIVSCAMEGICDWKQLCSFEAFSISFL